MRSLAASIVLCLLHNNHSKNQQRSRKIITRSLFSGVTGLSTLAEFVEDALVFHRGSIADDIFAAGEVAQEPADDLARSRLGQ